MDGFETAALIRQRPRLEHIPILFVSAINTQERDRVRGYALGAVDYIFTPVIPEILRAKVSVFTDLHKKSHKIAAQATQLIQLNKVLEEQLASITLLNDELTGANAELRDSREQLRHLTARIHALREEERGRIAREIHDDLGGSLTALKMDLHRAMRALGSNDHPLNANLNDCSRMIDQLVGRVRRIATELRPALLDEVGLSAAVEWQLQEFEQRSGIRSLLHLTVADLPLAPETATTVFRIFQEALTNVARHAKATQVEVNLQEQPDHLVLQVCDNGRGIQLAELNNTQSLGLVSMRERVQLLSGELNISGHPDQGTTVFVKIPLSSPQTAHPAG
jgi:signal transduction histidine kinase